MLATLNSGKARCPVIWLVGEFIDRFPTLARETFRRLVEKFAAEGVEMKLEILSLGVRVLMHFSADSSEKRGGGGDEAKGTKEVSEEEKAANEGEASVGKESAQRE